MNEHFPPRSSKRAPIAARVVFKLPGSTELEVRESDNLSLGGMFIKTPAPPPTGTRVDFEFVLTDATEVIRGNGEVTWRRMEDAGPDAPAGMGVRFLKLSPGSRAIIFHAVDRLIQEGGEPFDVDEVPAPAAAPVAEPPAEPAPAATAPSQTALSQKAPAPTADPEPAEPEPLSIPGDDEPLSELVARATAPRPAPAAEREEHDELDGSSTHVARGVYVRQEPERGRWWRLAAVLAVAALAGAGAWWFWPDAEPEPPELRLETTSGIAGVQAPAAQEAAPPEAEPIELAGAGAALPPAKPATEPEDLPPLTRIEEISWQRVDGGTEVQILGDGAFAPRAWTHYHLGGGNPRELIKVRGVDTPYTRSLVPVGSDEVRQVRVGYHVLPQANELHVVMDLTGPGVEASTVEADGRTLRILIRDSRRSSEG